MALPAAAALAILLSLQVHSAAAKIRHEHKKNQSVFSIEHSYDSKTGRHCRWKIVSHPGYISRLECSAINLSKSSGCSMDKLRISSSDEDIGEHDYCDRGKVGLVVMGPQIDIVLYTSPNTTGGNFSCNVTTMLNNCSCGYKYPQPLPTSRKVTGVNEFPMMVRLKRFLEGSLYMTCGGTIISQRYVLTAGHCVFWATSTDVEVYVGEHDVNAMDESPATQRVDADDIIVYGRNVFSAIPDYVSIALVLLASDIQFSERVGPACLPFKYTELNFDKGVLTMLGWGHLNESSVDHPNILQKVGGQVVSSSPCRDLYPDFKRKNMDRYICTHTRDKDLCKVESGGPMLYTEPGTGRQFIVGIMLDTAGCNKPGDRLHVNVAAMLPWIVANTRRVEHCAK